MPDLRKLKRRPTRLRRVPRPVLPSGAALAYFRALRKMLAFGVRLVKERLVSRLPDLVSRLDSAREDALPPQKRVSDIMDQVSAAFYKKFTSARIEKMAQALAEAVDDKQREDIARQIKQAMGVTLESIATKGLSKKISTFVAENVSLIKTQPQRMFDEIERETINGMREGLRHTEIARRLAERVGVAESRVALIARDQTLKFYADLNATRQQALGVTRYIWRTSDDERVREWHAERDGEVYSWDDPPGDSSDPADGGHPGEGINCRCWAEPVLSDVLDA